MNPKKVFTAILLLFAVGSLAFVATEGLRKSEAPTTSRTPETTQIADEVLDEALINHTDVTEPESQTTVEPDVDNVIVYYFHGNMRCATCMKFESYTKELLDAAFAPELASGVIQWRIVNVEEDGNRHFITDFQLVTKSVVLVRMQEGEMTDWTNLDKIWDLVGNKAAFMDYLNTSIRDFLGDI